VKNWIVLLQSILIGYATDGFTMHYNEIMQGTFEKDLFADTYGQHLMELLGDMATRYVFTSNEIYKMEVREAVILNFLMDKMVHAILYYDTPKKLTTIDKRMISFISDNYRKAYQQQAEGKSEEEKLYLRLLLVTDYICGMTDSYANRLYQEMNGMTG
jgi:dGTPase